MKTAKEYLGQALKELEDFKKEHPEVDGNNNTISLDSIVNYSLVLHSAEASLAVMPMVDKAKEMYDVMVSEIKDEWKEVDAEEVQLIISYEEDNEAKLQTVIEYISNMLLGSKLGYFDKSEMPNTTPPIMNAIFIIRGDMAELACENVKDVLTSYNLFEGADIMTTNFNDFRDPNTGM